MIKRMLNMVKNGVFYLEKRLTKKFKYLGWPVLFEPGVQIENSSTLSIGRQTKIGKDTWIRSSKDSSEDGITIGKGVDIGRRAFISCAQKITIGDQCLFGPNITVVDHNHEYTDILKPILSQGITKPRSVSIGKGSWLASNVVVLPGTMIGKNCVIAANSVVSGIIPDYSVVVATHSKVVKTFNKKSGQWIKK